MLTLSQNIIRFPGADRYKQIKVTSDANWTAAGANIQILPSSGSEGVTTVTIGGGDGTDTSVIFTNGTDSQLLTVQYVSSVTPISVSPTSETWGYQSQVIQVSVTSNIEWTATASESWISVQSDGSGSGLVNIEIDDNTGSARQGVVTFTDMVGNTATYTIYQVDYTNPISISPTTYNFPASGGTLNIQVEYQYDWSVVRSDSSYVSLDKYSATGDETVTVTVQPNTGNTRMFSLTFTDDDLNTVIFTGIQAATETPTITLSPSISSLAYNTQLAQFTITTAGSVGALTASFSGDVNVSGYTINGNLLNITTADNLTSIDQQTTITVTDGNVSGQATLIKRGQSSYLEVVPTGKTVSYEAGSTTFVISTNVSNLTTSISGEMGITSATITNNILTVIYSANTGQNNKYGYVTISGGGLSATASLLQEYNSTVPYISINPQSKQVSANAGMTTFSVSSGGLSNISIKSQSGSMNVTNCTYNNNQLSVSYSQNSSLYQKNYIITLSGLDSNNQEVSATATITQAAATAAYVFQFNPTSQSSKTVSASSQTINYTITSTLNGSSVGYSISSGSSWITVINNQVSVNVNTSSSNRTGTVTFTQSGSGNTLTATITQYGQTIVSATNPIWQDYTVTSNSDFLEYHIYTNGELIYGGKAYAYPNSNIQFTVNDVCSNYLGNGIIFQSGVHQIPDYAKTFTIQTTDGVSYNVGFYNSWAYEESNFLSEPIYTRLDPRQWLPISWLNGTITVNGITYSGSNGSTLMLDLSNYGCGENITVTCNGKTNIYTVCNGDYALYYSNRFGGWGTLLCNQSSKKNDEIQRFDYRKINGEKRTYLSKITPTWTLKTFPMFQEEGERMFNLLESNYVYLHNLSTNEIVPVTIRNSNCEYLNNKNNKKPYQYEIQVEESFNKFRK